MKRNDFIALFQHLTPKEATEFQQYWKARYSGRKNDGKILKYILKWHPEFPDKQMKKEYAYRIIFGKTPFNYQRLMGGLAFLKKTFKEFLVWKASKDNVLEAEKQLLQFYKEKNLPAAYFKQANVILDLLKATNQQSSKRFLEQFTIKQAMYFHPDFQKIDKIPFQIDEVSADLDMFFVLTKLRHAGELHNRANLFEKTTTLDFLKEIQHLIPQKQWTTNPLVNIYQNLIELHLTENEEKFQEIKSQIEKYYFLESNEGQYALFLHLCNFAGQQTKQGRSQYFNEIFDIYKFSVKNKLIISNGLITPTSFGNIIDLGCYLNELDWVRCFIDEFNQYLSENNRESTLKLAEARLAFRAKRYSDVPSILIDCENFPDAFASIRARLLVTRSLYFENEKKRLDDQCNAFNQFVKRRKMGIVNTQSTINYSKMIKKLLTIREKKSADRFLNEVENCSPLFCKAWFIKEVNTKMKMAS